MAEESSNANAGTETIDTEALAAALQGKPLGEMKHAEVVELAGILKIAGRHNMKKDDLLAAVQQAVDAAFPKGDTEQPPAGEGEDAALDGEQVGDAGDGDGEGDRETLPPDPAAEALASEAEARELEARLKAEAEERERQDQEAERKRAAEAKRQAGGRRAPKVDTEARAAARAAAHATGTLTDDDLADIRAAKSEALEEVVKEPSTPDFVKAAVQAELDRRNTRQRLENERKARTSPVEQYRITSGPTGMRYVTKEAYCTTLPVGSIVGPLTHDLQHVMDQGFKWEKLQAVDVVTDQMGNAHGNTR